MVLQMNTSKSTVIINNNKEKIGTSVSHQRRTRNKNAMRKKTTYVALQEDKLYKHCWNHRELKKQDHVSNLF
jgi:hypothetical protein